jgi:acyl-CoA reductase-like NAD-dependent aldehyde dehydrogenase
MQCNSLFIFSPTYIVFNAYNFSTRKYYIILGAQSMTRIPVLKTYKLFIGGQFPRSESGRYYVIRNNKMKTVANVCLASRKDFRNAVVAARTALAGWSGLSAFNRSQIIYRIAEMLEGRKEQFISELVLQGVARSKAVAEVNSGIDTLIYYAGWCDKYPAVFSSVNPVASPHYNFSVPEPMGVVSVIAPDQTGFLGLVRAVAPVIAGGNCCVALASEKFPLCAISFAEVLATSDLPAGVINILTGSLNELLPQFSSHMDVNAIFYCGDNQTSIGEIEKNCALNMKRFVSRNSRELLSEQGPYLILEFQEIKTTWHPIEVTGVSGAVY